MVAIRRDGKDQPYIQWQQFGEGDAALVIDAAPEVQGADVARNSLVILAHFHQRIRNKKIGLRDTPWVLESLPKQQSFIKINQRVAVRALVRIARSNIVHAQSFIRLIT